MSQKIVLKASGLYTYPNDLSMVPPGSMLVADNVVIDREGIVEPRRGFSLVPGGFGSNNTYLANQLVPFGSYVLAHYGPSGAPNKMAFYADTVSITGTVTSGSNTISNIVSTANLYVNQLVTQEAETIQFNGDVESGSTSIFNVTGIGEDIGLIVGYLVGGYGIPVNTTITSISGTGPYTVGISNPATATQTSCLLTTSNSNLLSFPANTVITSVGSNSITVNNNATETSRAQTFLPSAVTVASPGIITITNHGFTNGQSIDFTTTGTLPGGISASVEYFAYPLDPNTFNISTTDDGLNLVAFTNQGTGTHTVTQRAFINCYGWIDFDGNIYQPNNTTKMRNLLTSGNLYVTTSQGIQKLDTITDQFVQAGVPDGLDGTALLDPAPTGFMPANTQVAYRIVWGYTDANNNLILGVPSQRIIVINPANSTTSKNVDITATIPAGITVDYFYQAYRSGFSADANSEPNDELALIYEANPSAADLTNGYVSFTDETPDSLRTGASLYTNPSQQGITQENNAPPFATDITFFKGSTFYSNTATKQNIEISLLAASGQYSILGDTTSGNTTLQNFNSNITASSTINNGLLTGISSTTNLAVGQQINSTISFTGNITSGSTSITSASPTTYLAVGESISGTGIPTGTTITNITGTTLTISTAATSTTSGASLTASILTAGTTIVSIPSSTSVTLSNPALATVASANYTMNISGIYVGQIISGTGIPTGTYITEVYDYFTTTGNIPASTSSNPNLITSVADIASWQVGQPISGTGIPSNTFISSIDFINSTLTLSKNCTGSGTTNATLTAGNGAQISAAATSSNSQTTVTVQNGSLGIQVGDTITIAGTTFTGGNTENIPGKVFKIYSQGSPAQNINDTALSLIRVINQTTSPTPTFYAYYLSASNTLPGQILLQERIFGGGVFYLTASSTRAGAAFSPALPTSGTKVASTNDVFKNGLYYSKTQQPEAVPSLNFVQVGSSNSAILRCIPLRDTLFILKDEGIYRLTGTDPTNFSVDLFDSTTKIKSAETAVSLNNVIYMLSEYGVVSVSDTGVTVVSRAIEDKMLTLFEQGTKSSTLSFGISYETERKYIMFCITNSTDTTPTQAFVYNTFTNTWTRWVLSQSSGIIHPSKDLILLGNVNNVVNVNGNTINEERKLRTYTDFVDLTFDVNLTAVNGANLTVDDASQISAGNVMWQSEGRYSLVLSVDTTNNIVTVKDILSSWVLGDIAVLQGVPSDIKFVPMTGDNPGAMKQVREATSIFLNQQFNNVTLSFSTDLSNGPESLNLKGTYGLAFGLEQFGEIPFGGVLQPIPLRTYIPLQKQRCSQLNISLSHDEAYAFYRLSGMSFIYNDSSERVGI